MSRQGILSIFLFLFLVSFSFGQEQYIFNQTQVKFNPYLYNPAYAGLKGYGNVSFSVRQNMKRIEGAPSTQIISFYNRYSKITKGAKRLGYNEESSRYGYGAYFYNDTEGPFRNRGLVTTFSYHIPLNKKGTEQISFGIGPSISISSINSNNLDVYDDPFILFSNWRGISPDIATGMQYYGNYAFFGVSSMNIFQLPVILNGNISKVERHRHYFINGGGKIPVKRNIILEPSFLFYANNGVFKDVIKNFDINMTAYIELFSITASFRNNVGMSVSSDIQFDYFTGGIAYEIPFSSTIGINYGSLELYLGIKFGRGRNKFGDNRYR